MLAFVSTAQAQGYVTQPGWAPAYAIPRGDGTYVVPGQRPTYITPRGNGTYVIHRRDIGPLTQSRAAMARMSFRDIERLIDGEPLPAAAVEELDACFVVRN